MILPLCCLIFIACNSPENSSGGGKEPSIEKEPMPEKLTDNLEVRTEEEVEEMTTPTPAAAQEIAIEEKKETAPKPEKKEVKTKKTKSKASEQAKPTTSSNSTKLATTSSTKPTPPKETKTATPSPQKEKATKAVEVPKEKPAPKANKTVNHQAWDALLRANVSSSGKVNYKGFKSSEVALNTYLEDLKNKAPESSWSRKKKLAYWINAYNAFTVKLILDNYPVSSITKLHGGKPWDVKWIKIGGKNYSLNNIENDIIRPRFKEPRIHFAVNCAAQSCPPLLNRAWTADNLNSYFNKQTKAFINNSKYNDVSTSSVQVSKIFEWYAEDFGNLIEFLNKYTSTKINADAKVSYKEYDWALNN